MMSSILLTKARFAFLSELFDILQYSAVAVTNPSIVPITSEFFISLPPDFIVCKLSPLMSGKNCHFKKSTLVRIYAASKYI